MSSSDHFSVEEHGALTVVRVHSPETGLALTDPQEMDQFWNIFHGIAAKRQKVLLVNFDKDVLSAEHVDSAWQQIHASATDSEGVPPKVRALHSNLKKLIDYFRTSRTLMISAYRGAVDLDMIGLFAASHYRIVSSDFRIENRTIDRNAPPGSAAVWYLSRTVGFARAAEIFLDGVEVTAEEAQACKLVNATVAPDELDSFAMAKAEHFTGKSSLAISSLVTALNNAHLPLQEFVDEVGTGFSDAFSGM